MPRIGPVSNMTFRVQRSTVHDALVLVLSGDVVVVPGFNSHSGYYGWVAERLAAVGQATYAVDLRGRGRSDGERFYVDKFGDYVSDIAALVDLVRSRHAGLPVFLLGHSAGGVLACLYTLDHPSALA